MSASNTNIEKQEARHKGPLMGIKLVLAPVVVGFVVFFGTQFLRWDNPEGADVQIKGTTGERVDG